MLCDGPPPRPISPCHCACSPRVRPRGIRGQRRGLQRDSLPPGHQRADARMAGVPQPDVCRCGPLRLVGDERHQLQLPHRHRGQGSRLSRSGHLARDARRADRPHEHPRSLQRTSLQLRREARTARPQQSPDGFDQLPHRGRMARRPRWLRGVAGQTPSQSRQRPGGELDLQHAARRHSRHHEFPRRRAGAFAGVQRNFAREQRRVLAGVDQSQRGGLRRERHPDHPHRRRRTHLCSHAANARARRIAGADAGAARLRRERWRPPVSLQPRADESSRCRGGEDCPARSWPRWLRRLARPLVSDRRRLEPLRAARRDRHQRNPLSSPAGGPGAADVRQHHAHSPHRDVALSRHGRGPRCDVARA